MGKPAALAIILIFLLPAALAAQAAVQLEVPRKWIPLTAAAHELTTRVVGVPAVGSRVDVVELKGIFARNETGAIGRPPSHRKRDFPTLHT
jgi:hypothetical protein